MALNNEQFQQIHDALLDAYNEFGLRQMVRFGMDEGLEPGTAHWQWAIENAIKGTQCTIVLLSPDAKQSEWVSIEVNYAQASGRRIFPVLLRGNQLESVPLSLFNALYLDARQDLTV